MSPNTPPSGTQRDNNPETFLFSILSKPLSDGEMARISSQFPHEIPHCISNTAINKAAIDEIM